MRLDPIPEAMLLLAPPTAPSSTAAAMSHCGEGGRPPPQGPLDSPGPHCGRGGPLRCGRPSPLPYVAEKHNLIGYNL